MTKSNQELEAKFYLANLDELRETLEALGAKLVQPRTYERNLRFDTPAGTLTQSAQVLRLRQDTANRLTYKGPGEIKDGVSARTEIEFTVGDFENAQKLLEALGYQIRMIYEKYRTVYALGGVLVTLDEMPFGYFAEIEGPDGASIQAVCHQLGLLWELRSLQSYALLFEVVKKNLGLPFRDLTFENFAEIKVGPSHLELAPADMKSNWIIVEGTIKRGHQIASGQAADSPYPRGSIEMQLPFFAERGLDLSPFYLGTLNISIKPYAFEFLAPEFTFRKVNWIAGFPPEDFSFSKCQISFYDHWYLGYVYYPRPETKTQHFQDDSTIEIITERIPNIGYGDRVQIKLKGTQFTLK